MPRKYLKNKVAPRGGRRLTAPASLVKNSFAKKASSKMLPTALKLARVGYSAYKGYKRAQAQRASVSRTETLLASDNIVTAKSTVIGKQRSLTFAEKVSRVDRPPLVFKRNYQFNAEIASGRKGWFSFELNINNANDMLTDVFFYKNQLYTDTASADPAVSPASSTDGTKYYVDYLSERLRFMNSSSNALFGKIHLFVHKRDNDNQFAFSGTTVPITPINLMMFYSTNRLPLNLTANEATVGNGFKFDGTTSTLNYNAVYNMPGSSINATGVSASTDLTLSPSSPHISESMGYWFRKVETISFNLKPGQQMNKSFLFHDLKDIVREQQEYIHWAGVSYSVVVEFQGQIVGSQVVTTGDGVVSTGSAQLSCMRESQRILGTKNRLKSKIILITAPPTVIGSGEQNMINPDTGNLDTYEADV